MFDRFELALTRLFQERRELLWRQRCELRAWSSWRRPASASKAYHAATTSSGARRRRCATSTTTNPSTCSVSLARTSAAREFVGNVLRAAVPSNALRKLRAVLAAEYQT